jgi:hypothetical protein
LAGDLRQRNVENVEILPADQVQEQIERTLEGLEKYLQRLRRNIEIAG